MQSKNLGKPEIFTSSVASEYSNKAVDKEFNGLLNPTSLRAESIQSRSNPTSDTVERVAKQLHFFEWLFGQPVPSNSTHPHENHTVFHNNRTVTHLKKTSHLHHSEPNKTQELVAFEAPFNNSVVYYPSINTSDSELAFPSGPIYAKPRDVSSRLNNSRQIQITDVQASIGTELNEPNLNTDPSQVFLQDELDAIDRIEKNLTYGNGSRKKRQSQTTKNKFRQINIPYGSTNNRINNFSKRQLFMTPEQQMLALRQQQEIAAATLLQQQLLSVNNNRYNNRYIDDYYDDDSSYEDSDEPFEDFNRFGMHNPVAAAMNRGAIFGHPMGLGRRSIPDGQSDTSDTNSKKNQIKGSRTRKASGGDSFGSISKGGRWETIEDYDLSSDFNRFQARKGKPEDLSVGLGDNHKEMDESEEEEVMETSFRNRGRTGMGRQDVTTATSVQPEESSTMNPNPTTSSVSPDQSTTENTDVGESSSSTTEEPTNNVTDNSSSTVGPTMTETQESSTTDLPEASSPEPSTTKKPKPSKPTPKPVLPPYQQTLNCRCGVQSVRGEMAEDGTVIRTMVNPWLVSVSTKQKHLCSGSIINNRYILTSKQCVKGVKGLIVTGGMGSRASKNFTVTKVNPHESRNIALLKIKPAIAPNHAMRPICLPIKKKNTQTATPATGTLVTFKKSSSKLNSPIHLVQTEVPMLRSSQCGGTTGDLARGTICPGPPASLKCGGDTGGVLQIYQQGYSYEQIGVVANTVGCRANKAPGVYTDIRKSVKWILYNTKDSKYCRKPKVSPEDLMTTKRSEVEDNNESEFEEEEESDEEFTLDDEALQVEQEDEKAWE